jgi:hypothetical protein
MKKPRKLLFTEYHRIREEPPGRFYADFMETGFTEQEEMEPHLPSLQLSVPGFITFILMTAGMTLWLGAKWFITYAMKDIE